MGRVCSYLDKGTGEGTDSPHRSLHGPTASGLPPGPGRGPSHLNVFPGDPRGQDPREGRGSSPVPPDSLHLYRHKEQTTLVPRLAPRRREVMLDTPHECLGPASVRFAILT